MSIAYIWSTHDVSCFDYICTMPEEVQDEIKSVLVSMGVRDEDVERAMVVCYPGWCTGYENREDSIKSINKAIKEMRAEVKTIPTWRQYERSTR